LPLAHIAAAGQPGLDPGSVTALLALVTAVFGCLAWGTRHAWRIARRVTHFLDDYAGEEARDGRPATPGFMARLASVETLIREIAGETKPNHGTSLRDALNRVERDVSEVRAEVSDIRREQAAVRKRLEDSTHER
jgi:hypothetical protein